MSNRSRTVSHGGVSGGRSAPHVGAPAPRAGGVRVGGGGHGVAPAPRAGGVRVGGGGHGVAPHAVSHDHVVSHGPTRTLSDRELSDRARGNLAAFKRDNGRLLEDHRFDVDHYRTFHGSDARWYFNGYPYWYWWLQDYPTYYYYEAPYYFYYDPELQTIVTVDVLPDDLDLVPLPKTYYTEPVTGLVKEGFSGCNCSGAGNDYMFIFVLLVLVVIFFLYYNNKTVQQ